MALLITKIKALFLFNLLNQKGNLIFFFFLPTCVLLLFSESCQEVNQNNKKIITSDNPVPENLSRGMGRIVPGKIMNVNTTTNPFVSYSVYYPVDNHFRTNLPVVYFFDPHADGKLPVATYKKLADEFNLILIGCNSIENGMLIQNSLVLAQQMIDNCAMYLPVNREIQIVAGFSGGGQVACQLAMNYSKLSGLITCSGGTIDPNRITPSLNIVSIAGTEDFNYHQMLTFNQSLSQQNHLFIETTGAHQWPDESAMREAIQFQLLSNEISEATTSDSIINAWRNEWEQKIQQIEKSEDSVLLQKILTNAINIFKRSNRVSEWEKKLIVTEQSEACHRFKIKQQNIFSHEKAIQHLLNEAFSTQDTTWWKLELAELTASSQNKKSKMETAMYKRLLGFIGIAAYSYSRQLLASDSDDAARILFIYKTAEPDNSEAWLLSAAFQASKGNANQALNDFHMAESKGFKNFSRLDEFPSLRSLVFR